MISHSPLSRPRVGIDLLGSDVSPIILLKSIVDFLEKHEEQAQFILFGTEDLFLNVKVPSTIVCQSVSEVISMDDDPLLAVRKKKQSSLCIGIEQIKNYELDVFITAGNTGALLACSNLTLSMLPGIKRPALMVLVPSQTTPIAVVDVGANLKVQEEHLLQFALMGIAYQKTRGVIHPTVGLLNIGTEEKKGTPELQKAYQRLHALNRNCPISSPIFLGNIEGRDAFRGDIDVLVTDGFTGNIFLKTAEGIAAVVLEQLEKMSSMNFSDELIKFILDMRHRLHYTEYPGAILSGVEGIVIKCHGTSNPTSLMHSIKAGIRLFQHSFVEKIKQQLQTVLA